MKILSSRSWFAGGVIATSCLLVSCGGNGGGSGGGGDLGLSADEEAKPFDARLPKAEAEVELAWEHPEAKKFYEAHPEFFRFASPADLPADLTWENGEEQEEFASPEAIQFGVERIYIPDFPGALRTVGPDSSTSFRGFIHDEHALTLVKKHPETGNYFGGLASEWAVSEDKSTVYFRIDPKAEYSDGVPVRVKQFFFTFYFMNSPWIRAPWYNNWYLPGHKYAHITRYDDRTFAVGLIDAKPDTLRFFEEDLLPRPEHFYKDFDEDYVEKYAWRFEPTTGPYVIREEDLRKGSSITQTRQLNWWANDKKFWRYRYNPIQRLFKVTRDPDKAIESFNAGEYDSVRSRTPDVWDEKIGDREPAQKGWIVRTQFRNDVPRPCYSLRFNKSQPLLDNRDVREGLQFATDFEGAIAQVFRGQYERMQTSSDGYGEFTNSEIQARTYDPEAARKAFGKAGFDQSGSDGILVNSEGRRLSFTVTTGYKRLTDVLTVLQQSARKAGVDLQLEIIDPTSAWKKVQEKKHEITLAALNRSVENYPRYHDFWHSFNAYREDGSLKPDTNNFTVTSDPEWDALIERYDQSTDYAEIKEIAYELERRIHEDAAFVPGWVRPYFQCAYWRYIRWPDHFSNRLVREYDDLCTQWIDPDIKAEVVAARRENADLGAETLIFDNQKP